MPGEVTNVELVDDEIVRMPARQVVRSDRVGRSHGRQDPERCLAVIGAGCAGRLPTESRRQKNASGVWVKKNFASIEALAKTGPVRAVDLVGVVFGTFDFRGWN